MLNGVTAFWLVFTICAILFGFQNCSQPDLETQDLVSNIKLSSLSDPQVKDTGYYGGHDFDYISKKEDVIQEKLTIKKGKEDRVSVNINDEVKECDLKQDSAGLAPLEALVQFSDRVNVTHPRMLEEPIQVCSEVEPGYYNQHVAIGERVKTYLITRDIQKNCLMDDPVKLTERGHRVFIVSNMDHTDLIELLNSAEEAQNASSACTIK